MTGAQRSPVWPSADRSRQFVARTVRIAVAVNVAAALVLQGDRAFDPHRQAEASDRERQALTTDVLRYGTAVKALADHVRAEEP